MTDVYREGDPFSGTIGRTAAESSAAWPAPLSPGESARNLVFILLDDLGFGQLGCFGGLGRRVATPHIDAMASGGLRYNNFHVTPMCAPTRAALLSGRNSHSVGVGRIMETSRGYPGYNGRILKETGLLPAVLAEAGYTCYAIGKWHLTPADEITPIGPFDRWPIGQGFHRFYGFQGAAADQWNPIMWEDNHCIGKPALTRESYHLSEDLVDHAIAWTEEHEAVAPGRPYFLYLAFGAMHQPHHVAEEWIEPFRGAFADGWEVVRAENLEEQKRLGIVPENTILPPANKGVPAWGDLNRETRRLMERQMEVYAGFLAHTDHQIGRLLDDLRTRNAYDDTLTLLMSDNGSSGEGGPHGRAKSIPGFNGVPETPQETLAYIEQWGGATTYPNYATGWAMAGNSPNRWYKQFAHEGGTRAPLIVHWPERISQGGEIRGQFHAAPDLMPTILDLFGLDTPKIVGGITQRPLEGTSFAYTVDEPEAPTRKVSQYFEMYGHRAIWAAGWKAVTAHWTPEMEAMFFGAAEPGSTHGAFDDDEWELYHLDDDFSECQDLAAQHPDTLRHLIERWWSEAGRYGVLPLDDQTGVRSVEREQRTHRHRIFRQRNTYVYRSPVNLTPAVSPNVRNRSHAITAYCTVKTGTQGGVLVSDGGPEGGYSLCLLDGRIYYVSNYLGREFAIVTSELVTPGNLAIAVSFTKTGEHRGEVRLRVNGDDSEAVPVTRTNPVRYDGGGGGLRIGSDPGGVWNRYEPPFVFDGTIKEIMINCDGPEYENRSLEFQMHLSEQ